MGMRGWGKRCGVVRRAKVMGRRGVGLNGCRGGGERRWGVRVVRRCGAMTAEEEAWLADREEEGTRGPRGHQRFS